MHSPSSITRESVVASAAPRAFMRGRPRRPKMNTAFRIIFAMTAEELIQATGVTWSVNFITAR